MVQVIVADLGQINDLMVERSTLIPAILGGDTEALTRFNECARLAAELSRSGEGVTYQTFEVPAPQASPEKGR